MSDGEFEQASSGASETYPKQCSALRKGEYVMLKNHPCKISEMSTSKTGKHGHAKVHLVGYDIFDGKKYEDICPSTHNMNVPNVKRQEYQCIDVDDEFFISLMDEKGNTRADLQVNEETKEKLQGYLDNGDDTFVTVMKAMGREIVISCKSNK